MTPLEIFNIRVQKAIEHYNGALELGLTTAYALSEMNRLNHDDKLKEQMKKELKDEVSKM